MNTIKVTTTQNIALEYDLASVGERIVGYLIDLVILIAYAIILTTILYNTGLAGQQWLTLLLYLPVLLYDIFSEVFTNGQSVGKRVMNIKVMSLNGSQPTLGQYMIRWIFRLVDFTLTFFMGGLISVAVSERKQRLGDMVAGTTLIKTIPRTGFHQTIYAPVHQEADYKVSFPEVTNLRDSDMQLIKEVILNVVNSGNQALAVQAANKIKQTLQIESNLNALTFLKVLLADYNYITSESKS